MYYCNFAIKDTSMMSFCFWQCDRPLDWT